MCQWKLKFQLNIASWKIVTIAIECFTTTLERKWVVGCVLQCIIKLVAATFTSNVLKEHFSERSNDNLDVFIVHFARRKLSQNKKTFRNCRLHLDLFAIKYKLHFHKYHFRFRQMLRHECFPKRYKLCHYRHRCHRHPKGQYKHIDKEVENNRRQQGHMFQWLDHKSRLPMVLDFDHVFNSSKKSKPD